LLKKAIEEALSRNMDEIEVGALKENVNEIRFF